MFEGEYLDNRRWNGKGKFYQSCYGNGIVLRFELEYLNGEIQGKGKEYDLYGRLIFEGEYKNCKKNGKGKEYNSNGEIIYDGEYLNGEKLNK